MSDIDKFDIKKYIEQQNNLFKEDNSSTLAILYLKDNLNILKQENDFELEFSNSLKQTIDSFQKFPKLFERIEQCNLPLLTQFNLELVTCIHTANKIILTKIIDDFDKDLVNFNSVKNHTESLQIFCNNIYKTRKNQNNVVIAFQKLVQKIKNIKSND